jgi:hypothetical protein
MLLCDKIYGLEADLYEKFPHLKTLRVSEMMQKVFQVGRDVQNAQRFILSNDTLESVVQSATIYPDAIADCIPAVRLPWRSAWFEWDHSVVGAIIGEDENPLLFRQEPKKVGFMIRTEEGGRRGTITVCWPTLARAEKGEEYESVVTTPTTIEFDFDKQDFSMSRILGVQEFSTISGIKPPQEDPFDPLASSLTKELLATMQIRWTMEAVGECKARYHRQFGGVDYGPMMQSVLDGITSEYRMMILIAAMMNAQATKQQEVDRSKINKSRLKNGKTPLLNHHIVSMNVSPEETDRKLFKSARDGTTARTIH